MVSLITSSQAQNQITKNIKVMRLNKGLTQAGLAERSGVSLPTLRKFEQKGLISLGSFLKLCMALGQLDKVVNATRIEEEQFSSIDEVLQEGKGKKTPQRGWRK